MAERLTAEQETELRVAELKATKAPWFYGYNLVCDAFDETKANIIANCSMHSPHEQGFSNAEFIALARNAIPALLAELATARADRKRLCDAVMGISKAAADGLEHAELYERVKPMFVAVQAAIVVAVQIDDRELRRKP